jgi:hypothetical protein
VCPAAVTDNARDAAVDKLVSGGCGPLLLNELRGQTCPRNRGRKRGFADYATQYVATQSAR